MWHRVGLVKTDPEDGDTFLRNVCLYKTHISATIKTFFMVTAVKTSSPADS
jgi:hypothetical protein